MPWFYLVPVVTEADTGALVPDIPAGVDYCATYGATKALVRTTVELPTAPGREVALPDQGVVNAVANIAAAVGARDPLDIWRIGGV